MKNTSGLRPLGHAVLVEPYKPQKEASLIALPETVKGRVLMVETRAVVIEVGPEAWVGEKAPRAKPGDRVMISQFAGNIFTHGTADGKVYRIVNADDVYCGIEEEVST